MVQTICWPTDLRYVLRLSRDGWLHANRYQHCVVTVAEVAVEKSDEEGGTRYVPFHYNLADVKMIEPHQKLENVPFMDW